jgi:hypothetical protein
MSTKIDGDSIHVQQVFMNLTVSTINTVGNATYTAAQLVGGIINRDPNGSGRTDTTPTAVQIVSEMQSKNSAVTDGSSFTWFVYNTGSGGSETITLSAGTGVTVYGETQVKPDRVLEYKCLAMDTGSGTEAVSLYALSNNSAV